MHENLYNTYSPSEDEEYMCFNHRQYFKEKLLIRRKELAAKSELFFEELKAYDIRAADILDQSAQQTEFFTDFSTKERQCKLLQEIDLALDRIDAGEYGYCEITGEEIGLKRLEARPTATRCIEAQEQFERLANSRARSAAV
jgi:DnaK suppressor protein